MQPRYDQPGTIWEGYEAHAAQHAVEVLRQREQRISARLRRLGYSDELGSIEERPELSRDETGVVSIPEPDKGERLDLTVPETLSVLAGLAVEQELLDSEISLLVRTRRRPLLKVGPPRKRAKLERASQYREAVAKKSRSDQLLRLRIAGRQALRASEAHFDDPSG